MAKPLIVILSIIFSGALLLYTAQANLDLLTQVSPNPQFVGFAMIALEGGVIYWLAYYKLHWDNVHKSIAITMIFVDFLFAMTGFFVDTNRIAVEHQIGTSVGSWFPAVVMFVTADIVINVGVGIIVHLWPDGRTVTREDFRPLVQAASYAKDKASGAKNALAEKVSSNSHQD